jgi:putative ABC transport system permease protein
VRRHFPGENPIGKRLRIGIRDDGPRAIVGVVADYHQTALDDSPKPQMFVPVYQSLIGGGTLLVRAEGTAGSIAETVRTALRRVDSQQPVFNIRLMEEDVAASIAPRTLTMRALTAFAIIAIGLALVGIYAVVAYQVGERTREIGLRVALGARAADVVAMIVRQGLVPAAAGVVIGLLGASALTHVLRGFLFGVSSEDPATYAATAAFMLLTSLLACLVPARRATRVDPSVALRAE